MLKKFFAALTAAAMVLTMSSCGKSEDEKIPELTEDGKKIVKIYTRVVDDVEIYNIIRNFNSGSDEYEVQLTEFTAKYGEDGIEQFNAEMAAGNYSDILLYSWDGQFPIESYAQKGMLADIYGFMDADPEIDREDFLENSLKAFETDGKLYKAITSFRVYTLAGKPSVVGEEQGLPFERFTELVNKYPDKPFSTKNGALETFITYGYSNFIDSESGKCRFDSDEFISMLEFCSQFPDEDERGEYGEHYFDDRQAAVRNGTMPFDNIVIDNFDLKYSEYLIFGERVTFIGYPGVKGNGSVIIPCSSKYAILSVGANPEGAWQFIRYFYTEEFQNKFVTEKVNGKYTNMFPIRKDILKKLEEKAKQLEKDPDTGELTEPFIYAQNGEKIHIGVNTDEDIRRVYDIINGAVAVKSDSEVIDIITEEAGAYLAGQKSAEQVAEIIQNRVQNYVNENR